MTVLCVPLPVERIALRGVTTPMVTTGMGPRRAARTAVGLGSRPRLVAGVGGGLDPAIAPGDLVVATAVRGPDGTVRDCPTAPLLSRALERVGITVHSGLILSAPRFVRDRSGPAATGALAVDLESAWLAPADPDVPFAVVRAVSDTARRPGVVRGGLAALRALRRAGPVLDDWAAAVRPREVLLAAPRSFCAGVERAIDIVDRALDRYGTPVYVRRQIVHNAHVVADLERRGAVFVAEATDVPPGAVLVFAAHGVSPAVRADATARGLAVIDATCPLVTKVHSEVRRYAERDTTVFLIGHASHEEVEGTVGEAPGHIVVVPDVATAAVVRPRDPHRVAYAMQTTLAVDEAEEIAAVLRSRFPELDRPRRDDICYATTNRQRAVRAIARRCDLMVVVGSANSSNSVRLVEVAQREGVPARLVDDAGQLDLRELAGAGRIGLTAGASAPPRLVDDVVTVLSGLGPVTVHESDAEPEGMYFTRPKEVS